jgi:large subunit ribosomal protein L21
MYAIVKTGGKQYRVQTGQHLLVERLPAEAGAEVALEPILYRDDETVLDPEGLERVKVTAKVIEHVRGEKLRVFKFKPKRGYRRRTGHRQALTRIEIGEITTQKGRAGAKAKDAETPADKAPAQTKPTAEKASEQDKPPADKAAAQAKPKAKAPALSTAKPAPAKAKAEKPKAAKPKPAAKPKAKAKPKPAKPKEGGDGS